MQLKGRWCVVLVWLLMLLLAPVASSAVPVREVKDMAGRKVVLPAQVRRIVCIGGALRYVVYLQGLDRVVGVEALEQKKQWASAALSLIHI